MNQYTVTITEDDVEMILNSLDYEYQTHKFITEDYRTALFELYQLFDSLGDEEL